MELPGDGGGGRGRITRRGAGALALFLACGVLATWPAVRHADDGYLARPSAGHGEAAAGDHLQLSYSLWLVGHQLERGAAPWADPYSFRPEAEAAPNVQGWLLGLPYWPLDRLLGHVWAWNVLLLLSYVAAGGLTAAWLRSLGLPFGAALAGGLVFALAPYRVAQSTGHLLGLVSFLLPAALLALERRRLAFAALALAAVPLSGQVHLALGAIPFVAAYAWLRGGRRATAVVALPAIAAGLLVQHAMIGGSIAAGGRSLDSVRRYSAHWGDFLSRSTDHGVERLVFLGWLAPLVAIAGLALLARRDRRLALLLGVGTLVPLLLALGTTLPLYEPLWRHFPPLRYPRVPERLVPIAALCLAALVAYGAARLRRPALVAALLVLLAIDLRVPLYAAVEPDRANAAYAALREPGPLLELPVFRPDLHFGSVYLAYVRQSPRERPQGYSTTAPVAADRLARELRPLSCGRGIVPPGIRYVAVHRALYEQSGFFAAGCAERAERNLEQNGWGLVERDGAIAVYMPIE